MQYTSWLILVCLRLRNTDRSSFTNAGESISWRNWKIINGGGEILCLDVDDGFTYTHWGFVDRDLIFYIQSILLLSLCSDWRSFRTIVLMMKQLTRHVESGKGRRIDPQGRVYKYVNSNWLQRKRKLRSHTCGAITQLHQGRYIPTYNRYSRGRLWKSQRSRKRLRQLNLRKKELYRKTLYSWSVRLIDKLRRRRGDGNRLVFISGACLEGVRSIMIMNVIYLHKRMVEQLQRDANFMLNSPLETIYECYERDNFLLSLFCLSIHSWSFHLPSMNQLNALPIIISTLISSEIKLTWWTNGWLTNERSTIITINGQALTLWTNILGLSHQYLLFIEINFANWLWCTTHKQG